MYLQNNRLDRKNTHHAIVEQLNPTWYNTVVNKNITNQSDVTPPAFVATGTIPPLVINIFDYSIAWSENSYAVTTG
jgi:hypothetical protein